jgi:magnesium chelatase subunit I
MEITQQEAWTERDALPIRIPSLVREVVERVAFEAREDRRIDKRSGVSQRLPITLMENVVSSAERRAMTHGEDVAVPRLSDLYAALTAITGKLELEYEGELVGAAVIARELIRTAAAATLDERVGEIPTDDIIIHFDTGGALEVTDDAPAAVLLQAFAAVPSLLDTVRHLAIADDTTPGAEVAAAELVLEALVARRKLSRSDGGAYARAPEPQRRRRGGDDPMGGLG